MTTVVSGIFGGGEKDSVAPPKTFDQAQSQLQAIFGGAG